MPVLTQKDWSWKIPSLISGKEKNGNRQKWGKRDRKEYMVSYQKRFSTVRLHSFPTFFNHQTLPVQTLPPPSLIEEWIFLKNWIQIPTHFSSFHFEKVVDKTQTKSGNVIQGNSMKKCWSLNNIVISINMQNPNLWLLVVWISMREVDWLCLRSKHNAFVVVVCPLAWHQNNSCILDFMQNRLQNLDLRWYIFADVTAHLDCMGNLYIRKGKKMCST